MKNLTGFIAGFHPILPNFSNVKLSEIESWYAHILQSDVTDSSITFRFHWDGLYIARLKKIKENTYQGDFLLDGELSDKALAFIYFTRYDNSKGIMLFGSWKEDSIEYDCIVELKSN